MFRWLFSVVNPFPNVPTDNTTIPNIINVVLTVVGALCLLFITIGGFKYVISRGEPQATNNAKNTILYAVIGMVITLLAAGIVNFVLKNVFG